MTESQLNTDLNSETQRNTQYNKFALANGGTSSSSTTRMSSSTNNYHTTVKEVNERYVTKQEANDFSFSSPGSRFKPIAGSDKSAGVTGAKAIKVQDIPDGLLGRPVEFESKYLISRRL